MKLIVLLFIYIPIISQAVVCSEKDPFDNLSTVMNSIQGSNSQAVSSEVCRAVNVCEYLKFNPEKTEADMPLERQLGCKRSEKYVQEVFQMRSKFKKGNCGMTIEEESILNYYREDGFLCINNFLRNKKPFPSIQKLVDILNSALAKLPQYEGFVRRGANNLPESTIASFKPGSIINDRAFLSTSTRRGFHTLEHQFIMYSFTGRPIMNGNTEDEILLPSGSSFKVLDVFNRKSDSRTYYVLLQIVPGMNPKELAKIESKLMKEVKRQRENFSFEDPTKIDRWFCPSDPKQLIPKVIKQQSIPNLLV